MSDLKAETSPSVSVTSEGVARQIKAVTDPLTQQLAHLCELRQKLRNEQAHRCHEEAASPRAASTSTGSAGRSDTDEGTTAKSYSNKSSKILSTIPIIITAKNPHQLTRISLSKFVYRIAQNLWTFHEFDCILSRSWEPQKLQFLSISTSNILDEKKQTSQTGWIAVNFLFSVCFNHSLVSSGFRRVSTNSFMDCLPDVAMFSYE